MAWNNPSSLRQYTAEALTNGDSDWGWRDILGPILTRGVGATDPAWTQIGSSVMYAYAFALNDVAWIYYHIPHDYVPGTNFHFHIHWMPSGTNANSVKWQVEWMYADGHNQEPFDPASGITTDTITQTVGGTAFQHYVTETAAQVDPGMEPDGILYCKFSRITNGGTDNTDTIFVLTADVHYQSCNLATKNRAPDFYN